MNTTTNAAASNQDLVAMHGSLIALVRRLEESVDLAPTAAAIGAIVDRIAEVNARVTSTGSLLLVRQSDEIARHAHAVAEAMPRIEEEIAGLGRLEHALGAVTAMLSTVDRAVRLAELLRR